MRIVLLGLLLGASSAARADQCEAIDAATGTAAMKLLDKGSVVVYCAPCGDPIPATPPAAPATSVKMHAARARAFSTIAVDGKDVDLAYTYVQTGKTTWTNVGLMVGCGATSVPGFITIGGVKPTAAPSAADIKSLRDTIHKLDASEQEISLHVQKAVDAVVAAQTDADRAAAKAKLDKLRAEQAELRARLSAAKVELARAEREKGKHISKECLENPLAKGCS